MVTDGYRRRSIRAGFFKGQDISSVSKVGGSEENTSVSSAAHSGINRTLMHQSGRILQGLYRSLGSGYTSVGIGDRNRVGTGGKAAGSSCRPT
ncbi:hypothetical protein D9M69_566600 [compost metagenome]